MNETKATTNTSKKTAAPGVVVAPPDGLKSIDREKHFYVPKWCRTQDGYLWVHGWFLDEERVLEATKEDLSRGIKAKKAYDCAIFNLKSPGWAGRQVDGPPDKDGDKPGEKYQVEVGKNLYVGMHHDLLEKIHAFNLDHTRVHGIWCRPTGKQPLKNGYKMMMWDVRPDGESKPREEVSPTSHQRRLALSPGQPILIPKMLPAAGESSASEPLPAFLDEGEVD